MLIDTELDDLVIRLEGGASQRLSLLGRGGGQTAERAVQMQICRMYESVDPATSSHRRGLRSRLAAVLALLVGRQHSVK